MSSAKKIKTTYTYNNKAVLIRGGKEYFDQLKMLIRQAKAFIQLQVYIFEDDHTGNEIKECLIAAAKKNINIQILLDGYASRELPKDFIKNMSDEGIHFRFFEPIFKSRYYYFGRRLHHKIVVVDGLFALVGGINISDRYNDLPNHPAWLDYAVMMEGEVAFELHKLCLLFYHKKRNIETWVDKSNIILQTLSLSHTAIRIRRNDWVMNKNQISGTYMELFRKAQKEIIMMSSYFIPNRFFRNEMSAALKRGINIKLILAGKSDVKIAKNAERYFYRWALRNKIQVFEYLPTVLHGKIAVCDESVVTIGSYNINDLSALASVELNVEIEDNPFTASVINEMKNIISRHTTEIKKDHIATNFGMWDKLIQWASYMIFRSTFKLFTFYFSKKQLTNE